MSTYIGKISYNPASVAFASISGCHGDNVQEASTNVSAGWVRWQAAQVLGWACREPRPTSTPCFPSDALVQGLQGQEEKHVSLWFPLYKNSMYLLNKINKS